MSDSSKSLSPPEIRDPLAKLKSSRIAVLALEAGKTLLLDEDELAALAGKHRVVLTTVA